MNKIVFVLSCVAVSSFLCATEQPTSSHKSPSHALDTLDSLRSKQSQRQSSPRIVTTAQPDSVTSTRPRVPSNPIVRVKDQSKSSEKFLAEENITLRTLQRSNSADKK